MGMLLHGLQELSGCAGRPTLTVTASKSVCLSSPSTATMTTPLELTTCLPWMCCLPASWSITLARR